MMSIGDEVMTPVAVVVEPDSQNARISMLNMLKTAGMTV
jgi:hypothetical protein